MGQMRLLAEHLPKPADTSPLHFARNAKPGDEDAGLLAKEGLLDDEGMPAAQWRAAIENLVAPARQVVAAFGNTASITELHAFQGAASPQKLTGFTPRGESECTLAWPVEPMDLLALATTALGLEANTPDLGAGADLTPRALTAFAALVDAIRESEIEALLAREPNPEDGVDLASVTRAARAGALTTDTRWLSSVVRQMIPVEVEANRKTVEAGLGELVKLDWVAKNAKSGNHAFNPDMDIPRRTLSAPVAFAALSVADWIGNEPRHACVGGLRTIGALWAFEFRSGDTPLIRVGTVRETTFLLALQALLSAPVETPQPKVAEAPPKKDTGYGGGHKFCTQCGAELTPGAKFCMACGAQV